MARSLASTTRRLADSVEELGLLFSGGLDSALLAWILRDRPRIGLVTIGVPGSTDLAAGRRAARLLDLPWNGTELDPAQLQAEWRRWSPDLASLPEPRRSVQFSLAVAFDSAPMRDLMLGQGADELFWGYARFEGLDGVAGAREAAVALRTLTEVDLPLTRAIAAGAGRSLLCPYLETGWMEEVLRLPPELHVAAPLRKPVLRRIGALLGLPAALIESPKKAIQYGSGIASALRSLTGSDGAGAPIPRSGSPPRPGERAREKGHP